MISTPSNISSGSSDSSESHERRRNAHLRELIDEMMASIRVAANRDFWTPEERRQCEIDMARIMASVRERAMGGQQKS